MQVKRREEISEKIQNKIRSEANLHHEIAESERELKALRIQTDSMEYILKHKEVAVSLPVTTAARGGHDQSPQMVERSYADASPDDRTA